MAEIEENNINEEELERQKALRLLEASYAMYEETLKDYEKKCSSFVDKDGNRIISDERIKKNRELIVNMQKDKLQDYLNLGGKEEDLEKIKKQKYNREHLKKLMKKETEKDEIAAYFKQLQQKVAQSQENNVEDKSIYTTYAEEDKKMNQMAENSSKTKVDFNEKEQYLEDKTPVEHKIDEKQVINNMQQRQMYDTVKLPSKGQCYKNKKKSVQVAYLTAFDENMILSPNLYKDGTFLNKLLERKILDSDIKPEDLVQGDRDAIILWLRGTGYGIDYPIIVTDDKTGKEFETSVDLSKIEYKPFNLKGDENGHFTYKMPETGDIIKFRFLTLADLDVLKNWKEKESKKLSIQRLKTYCSDMFEMVKDNDLISSDTQLQVKSLSSKILSDIEKNYNEETDLSFTHELTDKLILQTVSVNGINDVDYVKNYIINLNVKDAKSYRDYMRDNEPGLDYNIDVERPLSLGGGSLKSFLQLDQFIFITV